MQTNLQQPWADFGGTEKTRATVLVIRRRQWHHVSRKHPQMEMGRAGRASAEHKGHDAWLPEYTSSLDREDKVELQRQQRHIAYLLGTS